MFRLFTIALVSIFFQSSISVYFQIPKRAIVLESLDHRPLFLTASAVPHWQLITRGNRGRLRRIRSRHRSVERAQRSCYGSTQKHVHTHSAFNAHSSNQLCALGWLFMLQIDDWLYAAAYMQHREWRAEHFRVTAEDENSAITNLYWNVGELAATHFT